MAIFAKNIAQGKHVTQNFDNRWESSNMQATVYWIGHWRKNLWFLAGSGKIMSLLLRGFLPSVTKPYCSTLYLL